jgi:uroporphyrin-III C-methyltransferase
VKAGTVEAGIVYLVGAGPGAADLLTLRAARLLAAADVVFHDALVPRDVLELISGKRIPVGKRSGRLSTAQNFINKQLFDAAKRYRTVVRLKGGDPMLFGRAHEEIAFLRRHRVRVEVVPGVTAALAASAELQVSLTRRGAARSVSFVTPRVGEGEAPSTWLEAARAADTVAIYMGVAEVERIAAELIAAGRSTGTPVVVVQNASLPDSRRLVGTLGTLAALAQALGDGPTLILLGETYRELAQSRLPLAAPAAARRSS